MIFENSIEVKTFLLKYLSFQHSTEPFVLTERNRYGLFLIKSLRFTYHRSHAKRYTIQGAKQNMRILIKEHYERSFGVHLSARDKYQFNSFLLDEFKDKMLEHVAYRYTGRKGDIKRALNEFRDRYGITEDDLPFRTLEKTFEREKHKLNLYISA